MTREFRISQAAQTDLDEIENRIAADNPLAAFTFIEAVVETFERIAQWPDSGRALHREGYRATCVSEFRQYLVMWRRISTGIEVSRVFRGDLDLYRVLPDGNEIRDDQA